MITYVETEKTRLPQLATAMPSTVRIVAPSRIHFGLLSLDKSDKRYFGGAGVMLEQPALELQVAKCDTDSSFTGLLVDRTQHFFEAWCSSTGMNRAVKCHVEVAPPQHVGLGLGTQLGMSVAWALETLFEREGNHIDRALSVGRGRRSAVGTHGFLHGGLIVDEGKTTEAEVGRLGERIELPNEWSVAMLRPDGPVGLAGETESQAFGGLPPMDVELKERLRRELFDRLVPAAKTGDFLSFAEAVYQFGFAAGESFASQQGGPFVSAKVAEIVDYLRDLGLPGVGQSSWGPTVYCWFPTLDAAEEFAIRAAKDPNLPSNVIVSRVAKTGAQRFIDA